MYKILKADKDTYITNRVVNGSSSYNANVGHAGSLDLFKLYGATFTGNTANTELSRILLHFDLTDLTSLYNSNNLDITHPSFFAKLQMSDVYGGQPTPERYTLSICPLSKSFEEGLGKDVVYYKDKDVANFLTASYDSGLDKWINEGCASSGNPLVIPTITCDYYTGSIEATQYFKTGEENLEVDVTQVVSGVLAGVFPDAGFRIAYSAAEETNQKTYFVKRFASRHAYDDTKHPKLVVGIDDSIRDQSQGMTLDSKTTMFFYNYDKGEPANLTTVNGPLTGTNCIILKLQLPKSGGYEDFIFTGSQHSLGTNFITGIYSASVYLSSSNPEITASLLASGSSLKLRPIWGSLNGTTSFYTGSYFTVTEPIRGSNYLPPKKFVVTVAGLNSVHRSNEAPILRVNIFDYTSPLVKVVKVPVESPGSLQGVASDAFYSIREAVTQKTIIPFDTTKGSTRLSSDSTGLYFKLDMSNLSLEKTYVVDILLKVGGEYQRYLGASPTFKVSNSQ